MSSVSALPLLVQLSVLSLLCVGLSAQPTPIDLSQYADQTVMVMFAHPDDAETTMGGTLALLSDLGATLVYVCTTNGDKGYSKSRNMTSERLAAIRAQEQYDAAAVFGVPESQVVLLDFPDGGLAAVDRLVVRERLVVEIRRWKPMAVFTWNPLPEFAMYVLGMEHTDHMTTGSIALDAVYPTARDFLAYPDLIELGLEPFAVPIVYLFAFEFGQQYVDISTVMASKVTALSMHKSQYGSLAELNQSVYRLASTVSGFLGEHSVPFAESFLPVVMLPESSGRF